LISFKPMGAEHWPLIKEIYSDGLSTGDASFQQDIPDWEDWNKNHLLHSRILILIDQEIVGWGALSPVSLRSVYRGVAEVSIYIGKSFRGKGLGFQLLKSLVKESEENEIWTLQSSIFPENLASICIHQKNGFRKLGYREKVGRMKGIWRDTIIMERRSKVVGLT
jgi:Sortase and related acyltransferases